MSREEIRSEIEIQIERLEQSVRDFDARKITYQRANQISIEADALLEKLRDMYMDTSHFCVRLPEWDCTLDKAV